MNLEDIAKRTINEIQQEQEIKEVIKDDKDEIIIVEENIQKEEVDCIPSEKIDSLQKSVEQIDEILKDKFIKDKIPDESKSSLQDDIFLKNIRERILVLFEGLKNTPKQDLEFKVDMIINFLEFLLANIEDKLKK